MENHSEEEINISNSPDSVTESTRDLPSSASLKPTPKSKMHILGSAILETLLVILLQNAFMIICTQGLGLHMIPSASIAATGVLVYYLCRQPLIRVFRHEPKPAELLNLKEKLILTIQGILLCLVIAFFYDFFLQLIDYKPKPQNVEQLFKGDFSLASAYFMLVYSAPVWEEIAFRGILQDTFEKALSPLSSILICGFIFGLVHADMDQLVPLVLLGWVFGWMYYRSRSIFPSILAHSLVNTLGAYTLLTSGQI